MFACVDRKSSIADSAWATSGSSVIVALDPQRYRCVYLLTQHCDGWLVFLLFMCFLASLIDIVSDVLHSPAMLEGTPQQAHVYRVHA
jgi:hypothetical protein